MPKPGCQTFAHYCHLSKGNSSPIPLFSALPLATIYAFPGSLSSVLGSQALLLVLVGPKTHIYFCLSSQAQSVSQARWNRQVLRHSGFGKSISVFNSRSRTLSISLIGGLRARSLSLAWSSRWGIQDVLASRY